MSDIYFLFDITLYTRDAPTILLIVDKDSSFITCIFFKLWIVATQRIYSFEIDLLVSRKYWRIRYTRAVQIEIRRKNTRRKEYS